jgi:5-methylcytosine-specific restriction endonuclease McrA
MTTSYSLQLKDIKWKNKRAEILKRDGYKCRRCSSKSNLHIHHKIYVEGRMAWEYTNQFLITLCSNCHEQEHNKKQVSDFVKTDKKIIKLSNPHHKKKKSNKKELKRYYPNKSNTSWFDLT